MEIEYFGANCFRFKTKGAIIVVDDTLESLGMKSVVAKDTGSAVAIYTQDLLLQPKATAASRLVLHSAGEYEIGDVSVKSIQVRSHMDEQGTESAFVYQFIYANTTVTVLGHIHPTVSEEVLELAGGTDVLIVPVGGNGFTLDAVGATSMIKKIEPEVVIPAYYEASGFTYGVPAAPLDDFLKTSGLVAADYVDTLKLGKTDTLEGSQQTKLVVLNIKKA